MANLLSRLSIFFLAILSLFILGCSSSPILKPKNEVLVMGTIHSGHLTDSIYNIDLLTKLIQEINPDYILAEIPPDRFDTAMEGFKRDDTISEPRVMRFPEYVDVVFPLTKTMDFQIIPTAGWTEIMATERRNKLNAIRKNPDRIEDWTTYTNANRLSDSLLVATGKENDPHFIHTNEYDSLVDLSLQVYNKLFNQELALGGWENINIAHYWNIHKALTKHRHSGKRFLVIYGSGHKGWFMRELRKREDITLLEMEPFLDKMMN